MKQLVKISQVKANPKNPRIIKDHKFKKLVQSIKDFPEMLEKRPIVVDENMIVLGGNMRLKACIEAGLKEVWIDQANWTEEQKQEFIIKDNVGYGEWDWEILANEWEPDQLTDWGLDIPEVEVQDFEPEAKEDNYEEPDDLFVDVKLGDLIEIGDHKVLCADSTKPENWDKLVEDKELDLVVTDPPYNIDYTGKTKDALKIDNDNMSDDAFYLFLLEFYKATNDKVKPGGAWYVWHASTETVNFSTALRNADILLKQYLVWVKNTMVLGRQDYQWQHELCLYGWKEGAAHYFTYERNHTTVIEDDQDFKSMTKNQLLKILEKTYSNYIPKTVIHEDKPSRSAEHPTMKPIPLIGNCIKNSSQRGWIVGDAFLGSGTTMVAAHQLDRKCYGMELDPKYCQVIIDRMTKLDPTLEIKINGQPYGQN
jgi:DNA modification methylase